MTRVFRESRYGRMAETSAGIRPVVIGGCGHSLMDFAMGSSSDCSTGSSAIRADSPFGVALLNTNADVLIDGRSYANGGYNFAEGGSFSSNLLAAGGGHADQHPMYTGRIGDVLMLDAQQNDTRSSLSSVTGTYDNYVAAIEDAFEAGWAEVVVWGASPYDSLTGTNVRASIAEFNAMLMEYARATPGVTFLPITPYVADMTDTGSTGLLYRSGYSADGVHYTARGAAAQDDGGALTALFSRFPRISPIAAGPFGDGSVTTSPRHPFGARGHMVAGNGTYNAVTNGEVAANWALVDGSSVTATPDLLTTSAGRGGQKITLSGTASGNVDVVLSCFGPFDSWAAGSYRGVAIIDTSGLTGVNAVTVGWGNGGQSSFSVYGGAIGTRSNLVFRSPAPFISTSSSGRQFSGSLTLSIASGAVTGGSITISGFDIVKVG